MKRVQLLILFILFAISGSAQNMRVVKGIVQCEDGQRLTGVTIKAVGENVTTTSSQGGVFEIQVSPYTQYIEATCEGYIAAKAEIDGSMIIFRLKVDTKYAEQKAKAEEQARIAAEKETTAKAKAEEQARIAAEKEAAAKAKAEEQARIATEKEAAAKAKAEEQARIAAEKEAASERRMQENAKRKEMRLNVMREPQKGYQSHIELLVNSEFRRGINPGGMPVSAGLHYIGGNRFNDAFYCGIGVGVEYLDFQLNLEKNTAYCTQESGLLNIPIYAHFRAYLTKKNVQPYFALSAGGSFMPLSKIYLADDTAHKYNSFGLLAKPSFGINFRLNKKVALFVSLSYVLRSYSDVDSFSAIRVNLKPVFIHDASFSIGCTF